MTANRIWALAGSVVAALAVAAGLYLAGAPSEERARRLDERRIADLMRLTNAIDAYWDDNAALPQTLDQLIAGQRLDRVPMDPVSSDLYRYETIALDRYRVCAEFAVPSRQSGRPSFWEHAAGLQCFDISYADTN